MASAITNKFSDKKSVCLARNLLSATQ